MIDFSISNNWQDFKEPLIELTWVKSGARLYFCNKKKDWLIVLNNFPEDPAFTLYVEQSVILHFDDFPPEWTRID